MFQYSTPMFTYPNLTIMNYNCFIGVDISKLKLDIAVVSNELEESCHFECENNQKNIESLFKKLFTQLALVKSDVLIVAENTGHYTNPLSWAMVKEGYNLWIECPNHMSRSQGLKRGKNDPLDAKQIAIYGKRFVDRVRLTQASSLTLEKLKYLSSEREMHLTHRKTYQAQLSDHEAYITPEVFKSRKKRLTGLVKELDKQIKAIEEEIDKLIQADKQLKHQKNLLESIQGVGKQLALYTLIATEGFTKFKSPRSYACYAGVAPFQYISGTSIHSKNRVSQQANRKLKYLLHMGALSSIRLEGEFKKYFERKVADGKNKMTVINAIRCKLIHRMFAVIRDNRMYQKDYQATWT